MKRNTRSTMKTILSLIGTLILLCGSSQAAPRPNIVIILADDKYDASRVISSFSRETCPFVREMACTQFG
jgi:hypothetical protein